MTLAKSRKIVDAPLLITGPDGLDARVAAEIERLGRRGESEHRRGRDNACQDSAQCHGFLPIGHCLI